MDLDVSNISDDSQRILLNKSASFSGSPIAEKYEIKQLFQNKDGETYIKHYRYEIPGKKKKTFVYKCHLLKTNLIFSSQKVTNSNSTVI